MIYTANYLLRADARRGEDLLGRLCADGDLDVLDGALVDWPPSAPAPIWHPLRNLPRIAALTQAAWTATLDQSTPSQSADPGPIRLPAKLARGRSAVIAICITNAIDRVRNELAQTGATVHINTIAAEVYTQLRNAYRARDRREPRERDQPHPRATSSRR